MPITTLPVELLIEIFKYVEKDYRTLYSCVLVNKQWHNINIPTLWKSPPYSVDNIKILINCLLVVDKSFLVNKFIKISFKLLTKPPLYNYARFINELDFHKIRKNVLRILVSPCYHLEERLLNFILDHSIIKKLKINKYFGNQSLLYHHRLATCFQNICELHCSVHNSSPGLLDKLTTICRNIQVITIDCSVTNNNVDYNLARLISAQGQIKKLIIDNLYNYPIKFSDVLKRAISIHSNSIIAYETYGNNTLNSLLSTFQNLKSLSVIDCDDPYSFKNKLKELKNISLPNIEVLEVKIGNQQFLLDLMVFLTLNGNSLKHLSISGTPEDKLNLGQLTKSIGQHCLNLEYLSICYRNKEIGRLIDIFNNCSKLKHISFSNIYSDYTLNGIKILAVLNKSSSKNLNTLSFEAQVNIIRDEPLYKLMKDWRGPNLFKVLMIRDGSYDEIVF